MGVCLCMLPYKMYTALEEKIQEVSRLLVELLPHVFSTLYGERTPLCDRVCNFGITFFLSLFFELVLS